MFDCFCVKGGYDCLTVPVLRDEFAAAWMNLGIVKAAMKKFEEAEVCYYNAIKHRRNYPDCFYNLGNLVRVLLVSC